jgi:hypothetical protein
MKWPRRKVDSKRRWKARFHLGKYINCQIISIYPELRFLPKSQYHPNTDTFSRIYK